MSISRSKLIELHNVLSRSGGDSISASQIEAIFESVGITSPSEQVEALQLFTIDSNSGIASFESLTRVCTDEAPRRKHQAKLVHEILPQLQSCFARYDSGVITLEEFRNLLRSELGLHETKAVRELFLHKAFNLTFHDLIRALDIEDDHVPQGRAGVSTKHYPNRAPGLFDGNRMDDRGEFQFKPTTTKS